MRDRSDAETAVACCNRKSESRHRAPAMDSCRIGFQTPATGSAALCLKRLQGLICLNGPPISSDAAAHSRLLVCRREQ